LKEPWATMIIYSWQEGRKSYEGGSGQTTLPIVGGA
jgi:hypothetical protein